MDDSGSDLLSSYETLSEESGSSDDELSDKDDVGRQSMTSGPSESKFHETCILSLVLSHLLSNNTELTFLFNIY